MLFCFLTYFLCAPNTIDVLLKSLAKKIPQKVKMDDPRTVRRDTSGPSLSSCVLRLFRCCGQEEEVSNLVCHQGMTELFLASLFLSFNVVLALFYSQYISGGSSKHAVIQPPAHMPWGCRTLEDQNWINPRLKMGPV